MRTKSTPPPYIPGQQAGLDGQSRRYRDRTGRIIPKATFLASLDGDPLPQGYGFFQPVSSETDVRGKFERILSGAEKGVDLTQDPVLRRAGERLNYLVGFVQPDESPDPIPTQMRAAYNLADYYTDTEGDVNQHITAPIQIALNPLTVNGPLKREVEALYAADRMNMKKVLADIMYSVTKYGVAYPYEVYQGNTPDKVVLLPPKFMWVGYNVARSSWMDTLGKGLDLAPYRLRPTNGAAVWNKELLDSTVKPIAFAPQNDDWNDQVPQGESWGMKLPLEYLWPVRTLSMPYERYAMPDIARAFHSIGSRAVFREMRRATIEGYRNQLWLFVLGEKDKPPSAPEMAALQETLSAMSGERTGYLAWRFGLEAKVIAPNAMDGILHSETAMLFTLEVFRDLGVSAYLSTGNPVSIAAGSGAGSLEIDLSIWLRRLEYIRQELLDWELLFRLRWAMREGGEKMVAQMRQTEVRFSRSLLEIGELIKRELQPLYMTGAISVHTFLDRAGYSYDIERGFKVKELPDRELNMPMPTYNQTTEGGGETKTAPQGRPPQSSKVTASWQNTTERDDYYAVVAALAEQVIDGGDVGAFIDRLTDTNRRVLAGITDSSYRAVGGAFDLPERWLHTAATFVNAFASKFGQAITAGQLSPDQIRARAQLYPQEGYKMAMLNGQAYAMRERGATAWKRAVYHPDCPECAADSQLLHAINEPFLVMHPNENCGKGPLHVHYFSGTGDLLLECPIPGHDVEGRTLHRRLRA